MERSGSSPGAVGPPPPSSARLIFTLTLAGLFSGLAIVGIYEITLPSITEHKARELREAVFKVVPGSAAIQRLAFRQGELKAEPEPGAAGGSADGAEVIFGAYDGSGKFLGYAIPGEGSGFQDAIRLIYGYEPGTRRVIGMQVLESRETPGLGDKIYKDPEFVANFDQLAIDPELVVIKKSEPRTENAVHAITGATISSRAVVNIIRRSNEVWLPRLPASGQEPGLSGGDVSERLAGVEVAP